MKAAKSYLYQVLFYELFIAVFAIFVVIKSDSTAANFPALFAIVGVIAIGLMIYVVTVAEKGDVARYPYGTGRLENASSLFFSILLTIGTCIPFYQVFRAMIHNDFHEPKLGWTTLLLFLVVVGQMALFFRGKKANKKSPTPMIAVICSAYKISSIRDCAAFLLLFGFLLFGGSNQKLMFWVDLGCSIALGIYAIANYLPSVWKNFCALVDFPLSEEQQIKIMGLLGKYFDEYEMLGNIYSTNRGSRQILEVELEFSKDMTLREFMDLETRMRNDFQSIFADGSFRIIPRG